MASVVHVVLAAICALFLCVGPTVQDTVKVSVYYESLCPDSVAFIDDQLVPTFRKLSKAIDIDLVPYGKANQSQYKDHWAFTCQHGVDECKGNKLHACLVNSLYPKRSNKLVRVIGCLMGNPDHPKAFPQQSQYKDHWAFTCQHGVDECKGNKLHACLVNSLYPKRSNKLVRVIGCLMGNPDHPKAFPQKVKVSVFYESLCKESAEFIHSQLYPIWHVYQTFADLELVPYGKANCTKVGDEWSFTCPHGPDECQGNKLQACIVNSLCRKQSGKMVNIISCLMGNENQLDALPDCVKNTKLKAEEFIECAKGKEGDELLAALGSRTHQVLPTVSYVPTIVFDDVVNDDDSKAAQANLDEAICKHIPYVCNHH